MIYIGIDCAKENFQAAFPIPQGAEPKSAPYQVLAFANSEEGFGQLLTHLPTQSQCVMEATGPYHCRLASFLTTHQVAVSVVNPLVIKRFTQMRLVRAKTDKADAILIAQYAELEKPPLWQAPPELLSLAAQEMTLVEQLIKQRTALTNQAHAFTQLPKQSKTAQKALETLLEGLNTQIDLLEKSIYQKLNDHDDTLWNNLQSIPGLGPKTAAVLLVAAKGLVGFTNHRQLISYVGLAPRIYQSGRSIQGKGHICKVGTGRIRRLLYLCALQAKRCNGACKALFDRLLAKGKPKKVALIAVANKLLKQIFAIAQSRQPFCEPNPIPTP